VSAVPTAVDGRLGHRRFGGQQQRRVETQEEEARKGPAEAISTETIF